MTEVLRPSLYGAQHPIITYSQNNDNSNESDEKVPYVVVSLLFNIYLIFFDLL